MVKALLWESDVSKIKTNVLMISSIGKTDANISPLESLNKMYDKISGVSKVLTRRNDANHGEILYYVDGYVTAWLPITYKM